MAEDFTFGDFIFSQPLPLPLHINGVSQSPHNLSFLKTSDFFGTNPAQIKPDLSPKRSDPNPVMFSSSKGPLPLSLFGQVEVEDDEQRDNGKVDGINHNLNINHNTNYSKSNGWFDPNRTPQNGGIVGNNQKIVSEDGLGLNFDNDDDDDDDDDGEWEFRGAFSGTGDFMQGNVQKAKVEKVVMAPLENQAGQDTSTSTKSTPGFSSFSLPSNDLFAVFPMTVNKSNEKDVGFKSTNVISNGFAWDAFTGAEDISNGSSEHKPGLSSSLPKSHDLFLDSFGAGNRSIDIHAGHKSTTSGCAWDAFGGVEKIGNGSEVRDTTANSVEHKPHSSSFIPPANDLFAVPLGVVKKFSETNVGFEPSTVKINSFGLDAFPGVEKIGDRKATSATIPGSVEHKPSSSSFLPPDNLFVVPQGDVNNSSETFGSFKPTSVTTNGFMFDAFPDVEVNGNGNEEDDFDDFGEFVDASQEVRAGEQQVQIASHMTVAEAQLENRKPQDKSTLLINSRDALPLSLFGDSTEETIETLNQSDGLVHKPTSYPGNGFSGHDSVVSIHVLISNLYGQAHSTQPDGKPAENGVHISQDKEPPPLSGDDDWDDDSWEFKGAFQDAGVREQPSNAIAGNVAQIQLETSKNVQNYVDFYTELRDSLCLLLSCQLNELEKARCSDTGSGFAENTETLNNEIQEIHKLLEQNLVSQVYSAKHLEKSSCLNEVFKILEGPEFKMIESEYSLSKNLQLAANDWRVAADLLRHAISILKILSLGSAAEQFRYVSAWSSIINVCAQELRYGALIWKKASEKKVQHQVFSHRRGQKNIQALGEIYKVVELLGLSAKVYKAWMLFSVSDSSQCTDILNECRALWTSSGLEEALQSLSDNIDFGCEETTKALLASIKNIRDFDVLQMHNCVFGQHKSICQISLLPQEMLPDLKTVLWNGEPYFISLANFWANLICPEPPLLPHLLVS